MKNQQILQNIYTNFKQQTGFTLVFGIEQEFYLLSSSDNSQPQNYQTSLNNQLTNLPFFSQVTKEKGPGQLEVQISPSDNPVIMAEMVLMLRNLIADKKHLPQNHSISFAAKPYPNHPGSAMHIHVHLSNNKGENLFSKTGDQESEYLNYALAGLLELMPASLKYFAPYDAAYARYSGNEMESPSTISWGGNNRTVSLRIPSEPLEPQRRRIEHRLPCADADPFLCIGAIILGMQYGIINHLENNHKKIFGNAFLPQYSCQKLATSLAEANLCQHNYLKILSDS